MKKILVALLVVMLALIATSALAAEKCPKYASGVHQYNTAGTYTPATCISYASQVMICSCGDTNTVYGTELAKHDWQLTADVAATCQAPGYKTWACSVCHETAADTTSRPQEPKCVYSVNSHKDATCTVDGYEIWKCQWCGDIGYNETLYAKGHVWAETLNTVGKDTCTTDQVKTCICKECGATYDIVINDIKDHKYSAWTVTKPATCLKDGEETRVCAHDKSHKETRAIAAKGHNIVESTIKTNDKGVVVAWCTVCEQWVPVDEKPVVKPEETQKPEEKPTEKPEDKPTTKPTTKPSTPNKPTTNNSGVTIPATGETMNVAPFIMMLVAIVGLAVTKQKVTE